MTTAVIRDPRPGGSPALDNMSCRPNATIIHPSDDPARQLMPALRVRIRPGGMRPGPPGTAAAWLRALGVPRPRTRGILGIGGHDDEADRRRLDALAVAVTEILDLPAVLPVITGARLPETLARTDPLLGWVLAARCSGNVWLRHRPPATMVRRDSVTTVLVPPAFAERILATVDAPDWHARVIERVVAIETSALGTSAAGSAAPAAPETGATAGSAPTPETSK